MDSILCKLAENRSRQVQPDGSFAECCQAQPAAFDVEIFAPESRALQIQGPEPMQIMATASNGHRSSAQT